MKSITKTCKAQDGNAPCERPATRKGYCQAHAHRLRTWGDLYEATPIAARSQACGTTAGFQRHKYHKEEPCAVCRAAMKTYEAKRSRERRREERENGVAKTLLALQIGRCAICGTTEPGGKGWMVDHDHRCCKPPRKCTECIRGVLCLACNSGLGYFQDDPLRMEAAIHYLKRPIPLKGQQIDYSQGMRLKKRKPRSVLPRAGA